MNKRAPHDMSRRNEEPEGGSLGTSIAACLILLAVIGGGVWAMRRHEPTPAVAQFTGFDLNISDRVLKTGWGIVYSIHDTELPPQTPTKIWEFDLSQRVVWEGQPVSSHDLWPVEDSVKHHWVSHHNRLAHGTRPDLALRSMLPEIQADAACGKRVGIILVTDGDCSDKAALQSTATQIAGIPAVRALLCVGLESQHDLRGTYKRLLSPLGARAICKGIDDASEGVTEYRNKLMEGQQ